jgi:hypothetical protein
MLKLCNKKLCASIDAEAGALPFSIFFFTQETNKGWAGPPVQHISLLVPWEIDPQAGNVDDHRGTVVYLMYNAHHLYLNEKMGHQ